MKSFIKRGPKGIVAARKTLKENPVVSYDKLKEDNLITLTDEELNAVIRYLIDYEEVKIAYGLKNCFPESPVYESKEDIPLHTSINDYYINEDCIIPLYVSII